MKKITLTFLITLHASLFTFHSFAQPCLPEGIVFETQEQIDSFQTNYPNCTTIEGDVLINGDDITNLNGLNVVTAIGGDLAIGGNDVLTSLAGLENLASIDGSLSIGYEEWNWEQWWLIGNPYLSSLAALNNLISIGGDLSIKDNDVLTSLMGIDNIEAGSITNLTIENNNSLTECEISSICGYLSAPGGIVTIYNNALGCNNPWEVAIECGITLPCLPYGNYYFFTQEQIDNFQTNYPGCSELEGDVEIRGEDIIHLNGLNIVTTISGNLNIIGNPFLSELSGLDNLASIGGNLNIYDNDVLGSLAGIDNLISLEGSLNLGVIIYIPSPMGWYLNLGNHSLTSLTALNNLTFIEADLKVIGNNSLISLNGLDNVSSIGGTLEIVGNHSLTSLTDLESVTSIGGDLILAANDGLTSLNGLETLTSIQGDLSIGKASKWGYGGNPSLVSLSGLENVTSVGGTFEVFGNDILVGLTGLDNIEANSISDLIIWYNDSLTVCEVQSICDYLTSPNGDILIGSNAPGCNSLEEVEAACEVSVLELSFENTFTISPNPSSGAAKLQFTIYEQSLTICDLFEISGVKVKSILNKKKLPGTYEMEIDLRDLKSGIYFCVLKTNIGIKTTKMIKL